MLDAGGSLTPTAVALNLAGGALLCAAAVRLHLAWRRGGRTDDLCFWVLGSLTGAAAITLASSELWDATWWLSHALRFGANAGGLWFVAFIDARSQAKAEMASRALAELNASLEERVAQRTEELRVARDAADAASRAKSEFLANMSHEIRTPLNAVIGLTDVVLHSELDAFQRDHLQTVMESGNALVQVINDILDFSKIEAGKVELERVPLSLEDVVCETLKPLSVRAQGKGLELACLVRPEVPRLVRGDPTRIRQVVTNLVGNAITYTEQGQVLVRVGVDSESSQVQVSVLDSGVGIPPEKIDRIFESFEQADSSSTRKYGGTGLGLSICRRLVEMMGGEIRVASEPGVGSVFSFTLDCGVAEGAERLAERRAAVVEALSGERVLIVDESVTERTILAAMAGSAGMRAVFSATSAEQARALLARARDEGDPIRYAVISANGPDDDAFGLI
jgi:signal transduction histidine kinase